MFQANVDFTPDADGSANFKVVMCFTGRKQFKDKASRPRKL